MTNTFNVPGVEENCFFLKDMEGAKALRQRINECFEISALPSTSPEERKRLLTFVVVRLYYTMLLRPSRRMACGPYVRLALVCLHLNCDCDVGTMTCSLHQA